MLYPLKFKPQYKERLWGGDALRTQLKRRTPKEKVIGESWEISAVAGSLSVVAKGPLAGNNLEELIEVYMGDLVGDPVYERFGLHFPLLVKLIDAQKTLSIQVHPDDQMAAKYHDDFGKAEMWYILGSQPGAKLYCGFNRKVTRETCLQHLQAGTLPEILAEEPVKVGDVFYIPPGTIHSLGGGCLVAEIQQTSDLTYRLFDWNRTDAHGKPRELHTELGLEAINFEAENNFNKTTNTQPNRAVELCKTPYFTTELIEITGALERDHYQKESFVIYLNVEGKLTLQWDEGEETLHLGECILVPACMDTITLSGSGKAVEIYLQEPSA